MWLDILNNVVGIVLGLFTGFYFERRATKAALDQNKELEDELAALRTSVYSVGGAPRTGTERTKPDRPTSLADEVIRKARSIQDAEGRISRTRLASSLFAQGHRLTDVHVAIQHLTEEGRMRQVDKWLELK